MDKCFTVGELFAGIGGIGLGFKQAGCKVLWANEIDKNACETYRANFPEVQLLEGDIANINPAELPPVDILTAGFPCQPFSIAGRQKGFEDCRGNAFFEIVRFIKVLKPSIVFLENVKNLTSHDKGRTFDIIRASLCDLGYKVSFKILNSKDFGVPQNRERLYMVCFRGDLDSEKFSYPLPADSKKKLRDVLEVSPVDTNLYEQLGNAVTVPVIEAIANNIRSIGSNGE